MSSSYQQYPRYPGRRPAPTVDPVACPVEKCQLIVDIVLKSSDGVLIGAHKANLESFTEGLLPSDGASDSKKRVDLEENAGALKPLMQFAHRVPYPDLYSTPRQTLFGVANAAEKYKVYSAMAVANACIRSRVAEFPLHALRYAATYNYEPLMDVAAPMTLEYGLVEIRNHLPNEKTILAWVQYKMLYLETFTEIFNRRLSSLGPSEPPAWVKTQAECPYWASYASQVQSAVPVPVLASHTEIAALAKSAFQSHILRCPRNGCGCDEIANKWRADAMKLFSPPDGPSITSFLPCTDPDSPRCSVM